jgi:hypothetical protein
MGRSLVKLGVGTGLFTGGYLTFKITRQRKEYLEQKVAKELQSIKESEGSLRASEERLRQLLKAACPATK